MKREVPTWAAVALIVLALALAGWWLWSSAGRSSHSEQVVPKTFGSEAQRAPGAAQPGTAQGADAP
ncbi:hypothetical protein HRbin15_01771 [bacterium HR15]|nr:hypothetical protein HRbin15_01771 [bacterium HR15]